MPVLLLLFSLLFVYHDDANAVPSFARQTGWDCTQCHMSWLELTNVGRRFKLGGYQEMKDMKESEEANRPWVSFNFNDPPPVIPLAMWMQISRTSTQDVSQQGAPNISGSAADSSMDPKADNGQIQLQAASLFLNGKLADGVGCFCQFTYDPYAHKMSQDNSEIRFVPEEEYKSDNLRILWGMSLNNNPGMSDIYNTTGVWGWPYLSSAVAVAPGAAPVLGLNPVYGGPNNLGHSVVGLTFYSLINKTYYLEAGAYGNVKSALHALTINNTPASLDGLAPYYRLALQQDWQNGVQSAEIGTYGFRPRIYPTAPGAAVANVSGPSDTFDDKGIDAQYQYITDKHRFSFMFNYLHEDQTLNGSFAVGKSANIKNNLSAINTKFSYYYQKWYGISIGYTRVEGSSDSMLYPTGQDNLGGDVVNVYSGHSPNSQAMTYELDWLFAWDNAEDRRRNRIILQYVDYSKFNGASTNYNGYGRNARDNNTIYLGWWSLY
jgi:hypothetical protein